MPSSPSRLQVALVLVFYMSAALVMVFVNKFILAVLLLHIGTILSPQIRQAVPLVRRIPTLTKEKWRRLWKVVAVNAIGLIFNALCLRGVDASFFQIARGLVLPLTILISNLVIRTRPSTPVVLAAACVSLGFVVGVAPSISPAIIHDPALYLTRLSMFRSQLHASPSSLLYGFLSSLFIALHAVYVKNSLPAVDGSAIALAWWSNAGGLLLLSPLVLLNGEAGHILVLISNGNFIESGGEMFIIGSFITGSVGFLLSIFGLLSVKVTSPTTHMFSSAARSVLQMLLGIWIFGDALTLNRSLSILLILIGTMHCTWVKSKEFTNPKVVRDLQSGDLEKGRDLERGDDWVEGDARSRTQTGQLLEKTLR